MKRRGIRTFLACLALVTVPLYADQYRVTVRLVPGEDAAVLARRLAATYRGELERPVEEAGDTFTTSITMGPRQAELLAHDPHVEAVQSAAAVPLPAAPTRQPETLAVQTWSSGNYLYDGSGDIRRIGTDVYVYDGASRVLRAVASLLPGRAFDVGQAKAKSYMLKLYDGNYEVYATSFENAWRHSTLGESSYRSGYVTAGDVYDAHDADLWP
jgi:hypothetical protein